MAPKGKQGTKGQKQIKQENESTLQFYSYIAGGSYIPVVLFKFLWNSEGMGYTDWALLIFSTIVLAACIKVMQSMAKSNLDLSMYQGMGEHLKDILIVTAVCQMLGSFSNYFWLLWLIIPIVAFYKLWVSVLSPWFFQEAEEPTEKQKKKLERKMMRRQ
uniref:transmembrane protein 208-like n=1 Tax=Styela clava TaxID=7725 RepID=UPI001939B17F|nr:transmembrane protein 208-like [Styela clava]